MPVTAHVFVGRLPNQFLPTVGAFDEINERDVLTDPETGDVFTRTPIDGTEYFADGRLNSPSPQQLTNAAAATDEDTVRYTTINATVPNSISELADTIVGDAPTAGQAIVKLDAYLRDRYTYDETAQGGSSFGRLERFLLGGSAGHGRTVRDVVHGVGARARVSDARRARLSHHRGARRRLRPGRRESPRTTTTCGPRSSSKASDGSPSIPLPKRARFARPCNKQQATGDGTARRRRRPAATTRSRALRGADHRLLDHGYVVLLKRVCDRHRRGPARR